jgi:hypothetical protein
MLILTTLLVIPFLTQKIKSKTQSNNIIKIMYWSMIELTLYLQLHRVYFV